MSELRWNPILAEWVATATHRQHRPVLPRDGCPFCPGSGRVPDAYDVHLYPNDFPAFSSPAPKPAVRGNRLSAVGPLEGFCDVVLYHPDHRTSFCRLSRAHLVKVMDLWRKRFSELKREKAVRYVLIFENRGEEIGVTMSHPHGQIYAFPFVPPVLEKEIASSRAHFRRTGRCLFCEVLRSERRDGKRVVAENSSFTAFVPFFARWPYEVHVYPRRHRATLEEFSRAEAEALAEILKWVTLKFDNLWGIAFPYMMLFHQAPVRGRHAYFHFHVEFYTPRRSPKKLKYLAGCETGSGTFLNDTLAEHSAAELAGTFPKTRKELWR